MATVTMSKTPVFQGITGLTNTTFDPDNYREDRMATEAQIRQVEQAIGDLQARKEHCCKEIVTWRSYVRVVAENTGIVLSDWLENMQVGTTRRGEPFTVEFALPHDSNRYFDDRSNYALSSSSSGVFSTAFCIRVNGPGVSSNTETLFYSLAVGQSRDGVAASGGTQTATRFASTSIYWPVSPNYNPTLLDYSSTSSNYEGKPLPRVSDASDIVDLYYAYKDATDNKIKIDVRRRDQYAANEYLALFFIQFVQRAGYAG